MIDHVERRFLSFFLAILMIISVVPVNAFAASSRTETGSIGEIGWSATIPTENDKSADLGSVTVDGTTMNITAKAEAVENCGSWSHNMTTTTVTFTNNGTVDAIIGFDFDNGATIGGEEYATAGTFTSVSLAPKDTVAVSFNSPTSGENKVGGGNTATLILSNIRWTANVTRNMTVVPGTNGTVKVAGTAISTNKTQSVAYADGLNVSAEAASGYKFLAWVDENNTVLATTASANIKPEHEGVTVSALFVPTSENGHWIGNKKIFTDFQQALDAAAAGDKMVKLMDKATLSTNYTIPAGVTVLIPHNQELTVYGANPVAIARPDGTLAAPKAYSTLTLASGVVLTVRGSLEAAAQHYVAHGGKFDGGRVIDYYGHIVTGSGSRIDVESGGKLYAWGYVTGSGAVDAKSGATVYEKFQISDYRGGGITSIIVPAGIFPFNQYYVQNVEVPETIHAGATLICHAGIYGAEVVTSSIEFIGSNGMFNLGNGGKATKRYDAASDRLNIDVEGQVGLNGISLMGYNTANFILPINNNITVNVNSGATTINQDVMLLPGTEVNVARDAYLMLANSKKVYLMDSSNWGNYCFGAAMRPIYWTVANGTTVKRNTLTDARINLDGTAVIQGQVYASTAGALIESTGKTGVMILMNSAPSSTTNVKQSAATSAGLTGMTTNISVDAALLTNADDTTVNTKGGAAGTTYVYDTILDKWVTTAVTIAPTLTYHANDGSENPATVTNTVNFQNTALSAKPLSFALAQNTFTRDGYNFAGWGYEPVAAAEAVAEDATDVTGDEVAGEVSNEVTDEVSDEAAGAEVDVASVEAAASYEEFAQTFQPGKMVTISANTTLYAIWEGNPFQVYVDGKLDGEQLVGTDLTDYLKDLENSKTDFVLKSWKFYKDADSTEEVTLTDNKMPAHDLYIVGEWEAAKVSSPVYVDGEQKADEYVEGDDLNILLAMFNKTVEDFNFYKADGTNVTEVIRADGKMPAYALYAKTLYTATVVNPAGGEALAVWKEEAGADLTEQIKTLPADVTPPTNKKFVGWFVDGDVNAAIPTVMPAKDFEIMAAYEDLLTVKYMVDGEEYGDGRADANNRFTIKINDPTKANYNFTGWLYNGKTYKKGETITLTENAELVAQFAIKTYTITWNINGQSYGTTVEHGTVPAFTGNTDKAADDTNHYTFLGWHTVENGSVAIDIPEATADAIYYAVYTTTAHNYEETSRTDATCSATGSVSYKCSGCEKTKTETLEINASAHNWGTASIKWADDGSSVKATRTCILNDEHEETATLKGEITSEITKDPSCFETGNTTYTAVFEEKWAGTSMKEVIGNVPMTPHEYEVAGEYTWNGVASCSVVGDCKNCDATVTANAAITSNTTEGNCQVAAVTTYTATFTETWAKNQAKEVPGEKDMSKHTSDDFTYTDNKDGKTHTKKHACCGTDVNTAEPHNYVNGICVCEAVQNFTVIWYADGKEVYRETVTYGADASVKEVPKKTGFTGEWDHNGTNITEDTEINAVYTKLTYTITLDAGEHGYFGQNEQTRTYSQAYDSDLMLESPTAMEGYYLVGWTVDGNSAELPATMPAVNWTYVAQWELIDVTVKFHEGDTKELSGKYFGKVTAPTLEKEGHTFLGWDDNTNPEDTKVLYAGGAEITLNNSVKDKLLYAKWQAKAYNITWILNGGSCAEELIETEKCGDQVTLPRSGNMTKPGATFKEWTVSDGVEIEDNDWEYGTSCFIMPAHDVIVTANWEMIEYTVSCMDAGGNVVKNWTAFYGNEISETDMPVLTKDSTAQYEYTFSHWTVNGQKVTFPVTVTGDMEFVPVFTETLREYDITFVVEGQEDKVVSTKHGETPVYDADGKVPTRASDEQYSYTFAGWDTDLVPVTGAATYTATWTKTPVEYTVTVKIDGETVYSVTDGYGTAITYPEYVTNPTKTGYTFGQWDAELPATIPVGGATISGSFKVNQYTITFKNHEWSPEFDFEDIVIKKDYNAAITEADLVAVEALNDAHTGYDVSWYVISNDTENPFFGEGAYKYSIPEQMPAQNVEVYSYWKTEYYSFKIESSIDDKNLFDRHIDYNATIRNADDLKLVWGFDIGENTPDGYTFKEYQLNGEPLQYPYRHEQTAALELVAKFEPIDYTITFMDDDELYAEVTAPYGSAITLPEDPTKEGYTFAGWVDADNNAANLTIMPLNGMTVYATFTVDEFMVNFFATEGDATAVTSFPVIYGTDLLTATEDNPETPEVDESEPSYLAGLLAQVADPTKEGHTWTGWDTSKVPATMPAEAVNIYGTWRVQQHVLDIWGLIVGGEQVNYFTWVLYGTSFESAEAVLNKGGWDSAMNAPGYTFNGLTHEDGTSVTYPFVMPAGHVILKATYSPKSYTITFNTDGGNAIDPITAEYGSTITWPANPTKDGHKFLGWSTDGETVMENLPESMPVGGLNLKAVWQRDTIYITWIIEGVETSQEFKYGDALTAPEATKATDAKWTYKHTGWDPALPETVTEANTYTAVFAEDEAVKYNVKFLNGETTVYETQIAWNGEVTLDGFTAPTQTGNDLTWTVEGAEVSFPYAMTTKEVTFLAKWTPKTYTITIDGEEVGTYAYGAAISIPDPTKEGHTFLGWKKDGVEGYCTLPETMPAENIVITSDWKVNTHTLKFEYWAGESDWQIEEYKDVAYGTDLADLIPTVPSWTDSEGLLHEFQAWSDGTAFGVPEKMPDKDLSVYATFTFTGWSDEYDKENNYLGTTYYTKSEKTYFNRWTTIEGADYYFDGASYIQKDITLIDGSYYAFDHDSGKFLGDLTGIYTASNGDLYYVENGIAVKNYGLHKVVDENGHIHYYIFGCGLANCQEEGGCQGEYKAQKNNFHMVSKTNGYPLPAGAYDTGDDCVLLHEDDTSLNGICAVEGGLRYMIDGVPVHKGLFEQNGSIYYAKTRGWLVVGQKYWISSNKLNGLTIDGELITAGVYEFDGEGKMIFVTEKNGFYYNTTEGAWYYYVDNKTSYEGLRYFDGTDGVNGTNGGVLGCTEGHPGYYYINTYGKVIAGRDYWITKTNNTGIKNQTYTFDENGVMQNPVQIRNGIYAEGGKLYYYQDSKLVHAGMLVYSGDLHNEDGTVTADVYNEDYIYVNTKGELKADCSYWTSKTNGLIPAMSYTFDEYGRMVNRPEDSEEGTVKDGIVRENGSLYYYEDGVRTYAGVICIDGKYYYVRTSGELAHSRDYWPTKHNGLVKLQTYTFDENGVMQNPVVLGE